MNILDSNSNMSNFAKQGGSRHNCLCPFSATMLVHCKAVAKDTVSCINFMPHYRHCSKRGHSGSEGALSSEYIVGLIQLL